MRKFKLILLGLYLSLNCGFARAAEYQVPFDIPLENILSHGTLHEAGILRAMLSLAIVIGLIYLTALVYKKLNVFNSSKFTKDDKKNSINKFKVVSSQSLGANKNLHVVEINGKYLVLGSTQNNINLIKEFDKNILEPSSKTVETQEVKCDGWVNDLLDKYSSDKLDENDAEDKK